MTQAEPASGTESNEDAPKPTAPSERIVSLDVLRGFALLGILVINIWLFSMPQAAAFNPTAYGDFTGANYAVWFVSHVFFDQKFMTLFTLLFGAGILLFTASKERNGQPAIRLHYRRTILLVLIGLGHAYLLWYGDILVVYGICALVVIFARNWSPIKQALTGLTMLAVPTLFSVLGWRYAEHVPEETLALWNPSQAVIRDEITAYQGPWADQFAYRVPTVLEAHLFDIPVWLFWRVSGLMLIGMALFSWGVLSNDRSERFYRRLFVAGAVTGLSLILVGVWYNTTQEWTFSEAFFIGRQFNYWGSIPLAVAYVAGIMLWCRRRPTGVVSAALAAVGQTAFSNYLLQTILATSIFYGHGLGLFGTVTRLEALAVVLMIWAVQIPLSVLWLRHFRYGPIEWVWRILTYGERQPLKKPETEQSQPVKTKKTERSD
ncbi:DUF418 domain-containing protein [Natronorubrum sp. DTA7]|uniref:DUF418 domain-containing protein n=1 Tax=Natronorubrum sp. DTA7 TaxID=3447016 RepID=UPI003F834749